MEYTNKYIKKIIVSLTALLMAFTLCIRPCNIYGDELTPTDKDLITNFVGAMLVASGVALTTGVDKSIEIFTNTFIYKLGSKAFNLAKDLNNAIVAGYQYVKYDRYTLDAFNDTYDTFLTSNKIYTSFVDTSWTIGEVKTFNLPPFDSIPYYSTSLNNASYEATLPFRYQLDGLPKFISSDGKPCNSVAVWKRSRNSSAEVCAWLMLGSSPTYITLSKTCTSETLPNLEVRMNAYQASSDRYSYSYKWSTDSTWKDVSSYAIGNLYTKTLTTNPIYSHTGTMPLTLADSVALPLPGYGDDLKDKDADDVRNDDDTIAWPVGGILNPPLPGEGETDTPGEGETDTDDNPVVVIPGVGTLTGGLTGELDDNGQETWKWALSIPILESLLKGINSLINNIKNIDLLKPLKDFFSWLFVPNVEILKASLIELKDMIIASHSLLTYPISLLTNVINKVLSINPGDFIISLDFPFNNNTIHTEFNFSEQARTRFKNYYDVYIMLVNAMLSISVINLGYRKFKHMFDISEG